MIPVRDVTSLANTLAGFKPYPAVVEAIRHAAADPNAGVRDVVRFLEADVGVATDLLRVANASSSALSEKCTSIRHAASLLGLRRVVELVASAAALSYVETSTAEFPELAAHALGVAGIARAFAPITGLPPDEAFTAGLLHDIGVLLLVQSDDLFYKGLIESAGRAEEPSVTDEIALMGFDHATLGEAVARAWNLPPPLPQVIGLHHDWDGALVAGGAICAMVALLRVGDTLMPALQAFPSPSLDDLTPLFDEPAFGHLGLTREELHRMWESLRLGCDRANVVTTTLEAPPLHVEHVRAPQPPPARVSFEVETQGRQITWGILGAAALILTGAAGVAFLLIG